MVYKLVFILLFSANVFAQNVWYVDANATGANTGRSWTDAWNYFDSSGWAGTGGINWAIIGSGDTIYVSGGTDSTVYTPSLGANNTYGLWISPDVAVTVPGDPAVIAPAWHEGHNGKVVIATSADNQNALLRIRSLSNIKITGITFYDFRDPEGGAIFVMVGDYSQDPSSDIHIDNCTFIANGKGNIIHFDISNWTLSNCYIEHTLNDSPNDSDPITSFFGQGTVLIENNTVIQRNTNIGTDAHRDMIQFGYFQGSEVEVIIRNNIFAQIGEASSWNAIIYSSISTADTKWYIYNNVMLGTTTSSSIGGVFLYNSDSAKSENYWVFNNTIIINDPGTGLSMPLSTGSNYNTDTVIYKNNLIVTDAPVNYMFNVPAFYWKEYYRKIDYNAWMEYGGLSGNFMPGNGFGAWTYEQWQADDPENDANSITGDSDTVTFVNKYGVAFEDYYTTTGRGLGVNLADEHPEIVAKFPDIMYDALGNPRPESGAWDIGALQFIEGSADTIPSFNFTSVTDAELNSYHIATSIFTNADSTFHVWTETSDSFKVGALSDFDIIMVEAEAGDTVYISNVASGLYSTPTTSTIIAGGVERTFSVTTKAEPPPPTGPIIWLSTDGKKLTSQGRRLVFINEE